MFCNASPIRAATALTLFVTSPLFAANLIVNGDFSGGNAGFTTGYTLTTSTPYLFQNGIWGIYAVEPIGSVGGSSAYGDWYNVTTDPFGGNGNVIVADGSPVADTIVWSEMVAVTPHTNYTFSFYGAEISNACCTNAVLVPTINGTSGAALNANGAWQQNPPFTWNSGASETATLALVDTNISGPYNDFVLTGLSLIPATAPPSFAAGKATLPSLSVGGALYSNCVISIAGLVSGPTGSSPNGSVAFYNTANHELTVPAVTVGATTYYNVVATAGNLDSVGGVTGADSYDGTHLTISSVQVAGKIYSNVVITVGRIISILKGMPTATMDQYDPKTGQLLIPAVEYAGNVYTNVTIAVGTIISVNGSPP